MKLSHYLRSVFALSLILGLSNAYACNEAGTSGFMEENNLWISVNDKNPQGITQDEFNRAIDDVEQIYAPIVEQQGGKLQVERRWEDGTVNAYAQREGSTWKVTMFGGLARHEATTVDGFALVICHELGHHLAGVPKKKTWMGIAWASNEGQADYWGNLKCMRRYMQKDNNVEVVSKMTIPAVVKERCESTFSNDEEAAMCMRGSMAGHSLGTLLATISRSAKVAFETPDRAVASTTNHNHPAAQCRLDTYFSASVCGVNHEIDVNPDSSKGDYWTGTCSTKENFKTGVRPLCWFNPAKL